VSDKVRNPYLWAFVVGCLTVTLMRPLLRREPPPPPVLGQVPKFSLVGADGRPFGSEDLRGHVYVASFFFTRCGSICPTLMKQVARLQQSFREDGFDSIRLVSISVDPDYDTPERLREAESRYGVDRARWKLLTGSRDDVKKLAVEGFKLALGDATASGEAIDIAHSGKLVLVDPEGAVRGYYDSTDIGLDETYWRSRHVLKEALEKS
jgi:protein SCO1/2